MRRVALPAVLMLVIVSACHDVDALRPCATGSISIQGRCQPAPSCAGLPESCGADGLDSCCAAPPVETTEPFALGYDEGGRLQSGEAVQGFQPSTAHQVQLSPFWLDRYEITVGRFRKFVAGYDAWINVAPKDRAGRNPARPDKPEDPAVRPAAWDLSWRDHPEWVAPTKTELLRRIDTECGLGNKSVAPGKWTAAPGANENKPMTCLSWFEAFMFCIWDGARLPTEAEWSYAAAGGKQQRAFPWSQPPASTVTDSLLGVFEGVGDDLADVGTHPKGAGAFSHQDLAGNAYEWVMDSPKEIATYGADGRDPIDVAGYVPGSPARIVRGGSFKFSPTYARTSYRQSLPAMERYRDVGARCARP